jgi:tetratricopeptide (TPR) repeat protein
MTNRLLGALGALALLLAPCRELAGEIPGDLAGALTGGSAGAIIARVTTLAGVPVPGALLRLSRPGTARIRELRCDDGGEVLQTGVPKGDYDLRVTAPGRGLKARDLRVGVRMNSLLELDIVLLSDWHPEDPARAIPAPHDALQIAAIEAFNAGQDLCGRQAFARAVPFLDKAVADLGAALEMAPPATRTLDAARLAQAGRAQGLALWEAAKAGQPELRARAEPCLAAAAARAPRDAEVLRALLELHQAQGDAQAVRLDQTALEAAQGPGSVCEGAFNAAIRAFDDGKLPQALALAAQAMAEEPAFADNYWLLGLLESGRHHDQAARKALRTYLRLAPAGSRLPEVRHLLARLGPAK